MMKYSMLSLLFTLLTFSACAQESSHEVLSAQDYQTALAQEDDRYLIDVRTPREYQSGHIEGATNWNFHDKNFVANFESLDKDKTVYVYCRSGGRSGKAAQQLKSLGFKKVVDLKGGILSWPYELSQE